jgi:hypothetical protein
MKEGKWAVFQTVLGEEAADSSRAYVHHDALLQLKLLLPTTLFELAR